MKNDKISIAFLIIGQAVSIITGIALFIVGGVTSQFKISIAGVIVLVGGILLTVGIFLTVYIVNYVKTTGIGYEPVKITAQKQPHFPSHSDEKDVTYIMDKEDEFTEELEKSGKLDLLKQYKAEAEIIWERYTGDNWDKNLEQLDELIDKYKSIDKCKSME